MSSLEKLLLRIGSLPGYSKSPSKTKPKKKKEAKK